MGVRRLAVVNGPNIFQMLLVLTISSLLVELLIDCLTIDRLNSYTTKGIFDYTNLDSDSVTVLGMRACKRVHDKLSCTRLQNYTIAASLLGIRIRIPKSNIR